LERIPLNPLKEEEDLFEGEGIAMESVDKMHGVTTRVSRIIS